MPVRPVRLFGDPVLTERAVEVVDFDRGLRQLVRDLTETMLDQEGAGLAAPQIGVGLRVFTYHVDDVVGALVNPVVAELSEEEQDGDEGCLSLPGLAWPCIRAARAVVRGFTPDGEPVTVAGSDLLARCMQHEIDHLDGVLFVDRLDPATRKQAMREITQAEWFGRPAPTVKLSPHPVRGLLR